MAPSQPRTVLTADQIDAALGALPGFHRDTRGHLRCRWRFPDFALAFAFATRIAGLAEQQDHHPDLTVGWGHVSIELWTHDRSGITQRDLDLAAAITALGQQPEPTA
jgi:4a-hydroxytetrahydrobiopterin dehydratase